MSPQQLPASGQNPGKAGARSWAVVGMLVLLTLINFGDKSVLGLAAVPLSKEFGLSHAEYGFIGSSFYFLYSVAALLIGFLALRVRAYWILLVLALLWSVFQLPVAVITSVPLLLVCRIGLGAAEGPATPLVVHTAHDWFPPTRRGVPTALALVGAGLGTAIAAPTLTLLIVRFGWRSAFVALALVGLIWSACWAFVGRRPGPYSAAVLEPAKDKGSIRDRELWRAVLSPTWIGALLVSLAAYWALALTLIWLPSYLEKGAGYSATTTSGLLIVPALIGVAAQLVVLFVSDRLARRGRSTRLARGLPLAVVGGIAGLCLVCLPLATGPAAVVLLLVGLGLPPGCIALGQLLFGQISPVKHRPAVLGIADALVPLPGLISPIVMGWQVDAAATTQAGFGHGWMLTGALLLVGAVLAFALVRRDTPRTSRVAPELAVRAQRQEA